MRKDALSVVDLMNGSYYLHYASQRSPDPECHESDTSIRHTIYSYTHTCTIIYIYMWVCL